MNIDHDYHYDTGILIDNTAQSRKSGKESTNRRTMCQGKCGGVYLDCGLWCTLEYIYMVRGGV